MLGDYYIKNKQAKEEKKRQAQEIAQAQQLLAKKRLRTPPKINWDGAIAYRYGGKINRHNQISGNSFGFSKDLSQGKFAYNFNGQLVVGNLVLHGTNKDGHWFR